MRLTGDEIAQWVDNSLSRYPQTTTFCAGVATFGSSLALSTLIQQSLRITTASKASVLVGLASVCAASYASHHASRASHERYVGPVQGTTRRKIQILHTDYWIPLQTLRVCTVGLLAFKLLGGRFWAIAPSSYTHLGSYARVSIPATERYATGRQRQIIEGLGHKYGCHTCGSRRLFRAGRQFVGDHMPPKSVAEVYNRRWWRWRRPIKFRFYPQCIDCSGQQGGILSQATQQLRTSHRLNLRNQPSYFHGWQPRVYHATGAVVAATTVSYAPAANQEYEKVSGWVSERMRKGGVRRVLRDVTKELQSMDTGGMYQDVKKKVSKTWSSFRKPPPRPSPAY